MSNFIITQQHQKKTRLIFLGYLFIIVGIILLALRWFDEFGLRKLLGSVLALSFIWMGLDYLRFQKKFYIRISDKKIEWLLDQNTSKGLFVDWLDIRWIKKEKDGGITFYQKSSFSNHMTMNGFTKEITLEILNEISEIAMKRTIRLINFFDITVEVA